MKVFTKIYLSLLSLILISTLVYANPHGTLNACSGPAAAHNPHCQEQPALLNVEPHTNQVTSNTNNPIPVEPITLVVMPTQSMSIKHKNIKKHHTAIDEFLKNHPELDSKSALQIKKAIEDHHQSITTDSISENKKNHKKAKDTLLQKEIDELNNIEKLPSISNVETTTTNSVSQYPITVYTIKKYSFKSNTQTTTSSKTVYKNKKSVYTYTDNTKNAIITTSNNSINSNEESTLKHTMNVLKHTIMNVDLDIDQKQYYEVNKYEGFLFEEHIHNSNLNSYNTNLIVDFVYKF